MNRRNNIIYWTSTLWLALGMLSTGVVQVMNNKAEADFMANLGYPPYFPVILGVWKILGVVALLVPRLALLKEWAYAGFFFAMSGAVVSHLAAREPISALPPSLLLLALTVVSWYFRPASRRVLTAN
ncbi:DoxX family protein [Hymenobacter lucidus]|uniref:DoxX family protein n=1 Tax=Hymenobacter lucidus TaxID=2880930 RepID=A0ABS8ARG1_9BACT|nr:DoxX family protein [Hymenobacter lucidus]MCB2408803.1 DoxX family protein [Hymenobacter lucidus]